MSKLKLESIIIAATIYLIIVLSIIFALINKSSYPEAKVYVEKNSKAIEVSLGSPISKAKQEHKAKKKQKTKKTSKKIPKKVRNIKKVSKKTAKKIKIAKKKSVKKVNKKIDASKLFHALPKNLTSSSNQDSTLEKKGRGGKSLQKTNKEQGVVNKYLANVRKMLQGWPAQSNFAGEKVRVKLTIYPSGLFDYKILYHSLNPEFNESLKHYLEQLKGIGFGPHSNPRPLEIIVEFIAK